MPLSTPRLNRRALLQAGGGVLAALASGRSRSATRQLPLAADLTSDRILASLGLGRFASVTPLGHTAGGRPIEMISVGDGGRSALLVGAPHPNEPIGCLTLLRLLSRLATDSALREASGWRWHIVLAIDLDGLILNEGWFRGPLSVERYCRDFYRPPFALQPEYSFPLTVGTYEFKGATPENECWQRALAASRPQLQCSLHGSDSGGTFFICSEDRSSLFEKLLALPGRFGLPLNPVGEPFSDMEPYRPGVVAFPAIENTLRKAVEAGRKPAEDWDAGDSSAGFAARRHGTFSMACEVPLWDDRRSHRLGPSPYSAADTLRAQALQAREDHELLEASARLLQAADFSPTERALAASLRAAHVASAPQSVALEKLAAAQDPDPRLSWADLVQYEPGTGGWRTPAMLARLADLRRATNDAARARALLRRRIAGQRAAQLRPVPLDTSSGLQLAAIAAAAGLSVA